MTAGTLYGKLIADGEAEHRHHTAALHNQRDRITRFGEALKSLPLEPHIKSLPNGTVSMVARTERGDNNETLFASLTMQGFHVGEAVTPALQFRDGYTIQTARVQGNGLDFTLLFYIKETQ
jgi:hypothetical protein